jgi:hypothetical protein
MLFCYVFFKRKYTISSWILRAMNMNLEKTSRPSNHKKLWAQKCKSQCHGRQQQGTAKGTMRQDTAQHKNTATQEMTAKGKMHDVTRHSTAQRSVQECSGQYIHSIICLCLRYQTNWWDYYCRTTAIGKTRGEGVGRCIVCCVLCSSLYCCVCPLLN